MSATARVRVSSRPGFAGAKTAPAETAGYRTPLASARSATHAYRTKARRLRQQYANQPDLLHRSLCQLSQRQDRVQSSPDIIAIRPASSETSDDWAHARPEPCALIPSRATPRIYTVATAESPNTPFARAVVDWFADQVARQFSGQLMHHSQRRSLLKTAERLGIDRFHANLIIAVAQHDAGKQSGKTVRIYPEPRRFSFAAVTVLVIVQSLIVWGAWRVLHGI